MSVGGAGSAGGAKPARRFLVPMVVVALACVMDAAAQTPREWPGRVEVSFGAALNGGYAAGSETATLESNAVPTGGPFTLFEVQSDTRRSVAGAAGLAWRLARSIAVEASIRIDRPLIRTSVSQDPEAAAVSFGGERFSRYVFDGSLLVHLAGLTSGNGRLVPYVIGGAGYMRQLHVGRTLVESGRAYHAGGGLKLLVARRDRGLAKGLGVRIEGRVNVVTGAIGFDDRRRIFGSIAGGAFVLF